MQEKIICVVGARPEAIKMAPGYYCLKARLQDFQPILVSAGQHRHMLDQIFQVLDLTPDIDLNLMWSEARLVGTSRDNLVKEACRLLDDPAHYAGISQCQNPYGDGQAGRRIVEVL